MDRTVEVEVEGANLYQIEQQARKMIQQFYDAKTGWQIIEINAKPLTGQDGQVLVWSATVCASLND